MEKKSLMGILKKCSPVLVKHEKNKTIIDMHLFFFLYIYQNDIYLQ